MKLVIAAMLLRTVEEEVTMKTCECGAELADSADRCPRCGARFAAAVNWSNMLVILIILLGLTGVMWWSVVK